MIFHDFKCRECGDIKENIGLSVKHTDEDKPVCCGKPMEYHFTAGANLHMRDYELKNGGFVAHSIPGSPVITSRKQNREMMRRHNLIDANDMGPPPTRREQMEYHRNVVMPSINQVEVQDEKVKRKLDIV